MSLLAIRSALEVVLGFFIVCPFAKFHEDTNYELDWSSEFFLLVEWQGTSKTRKLWMHLLCMQTYLHAFGQYIIITVL